MKKLLVVLVLGIASLANAFTMDLVANADKTLFSIELLAPGMSAAADGSGTYFVIIGVDPTSGALASTKPAVLNMSSANYGDAGDTGLFEYGLGTYGEFRAGVPNTFTYVAAAGVYADSFALAPGAKAVSLYTMDDNMTLESLTLVETILIPEPATMVILALGGLLLRRKK